MRGSLFAALAATVLSVALSACAGVSVGTSPSEDFSSRDSEYRSDYEEGMLWANSLTRDLVQDAEESGSDYPRFEGFSSAVSQMVDLYGGLEEGCAAVVDYNFGSQFPEGSSRDAWVEGCVSRMESAQDTAESIKPD